MYVGIGSVKSPKSGVESYTSTIDFVALKQYAGMPLLASLSLFFLIYITSFATPFAAPLGS